ncbi:MAG: glutamyl-tRNA reductase [Gemmataceae bacterium]
MNLLAIGCSYRTTPVEVRERLAFDDTQLGRALDRLAGQHGFEAVLLSTCNRVELYAAGDGDPTDFLADFHGLPREQVRPHLYVHRGEGAIRHLFRVVASLDSLVLGEAQISGQVKKAYERALVQGSTGPVMNALFPHSRQVAKRVRAETGISQGHASISSAAVDYVMEVFDHFGDKEFLVIGAGKMGGLTLKALRGLKPRRILVTNRSPEKALAVARECGGEAVPWDRLDDVLARADIVLSTTGAAEPIMTRDRYAKIAARRTRWPVVILDIAVPRDFDPRIHDGETVLLNIDDLKSVQEKTLARRRAHVVPAEQIVEQEARRFLKEWARRGNGPVIERLTREFESRRKEIVERLFSRLNGKLEPADRQYIDKAFSLFQNQLLHGPISALREESRSGEESSHTLLEALRKLFRLE